MRLTLRTLMAHLDNVLEPKDAEVLKQKIQNSELATSIVKRIEASTRRPRLSAPPTDGKGLGADPNSVAEYLDNTLPIEKVPEFERICLESDVQLAEAASCHQILTLVLGLPIEVPNSLRKKIYELGNSQPTSGSRALSAGIDGATRRLDSAHDNRSEVRNESDSSKSTRPNEADSNRETERPTDPVNVPSSSSVGGWFRIDPGVSAASDSIDSEGSELFDSSDNVVRSARRETLRQGGLDLASDESLANVPEFAVGRQATGRRALTFVGLIVLFVLVAWQAIGPLDRAWKLLALGTTTEPKSTDDTGKDQSGTSSNGATDTTAAQPNDVAANSPAESSIENRKTEKVVAQPESDSEEIVPAPSIPAPIQPAIVDNNPLANGSQPNANATLPTESDLSAALPSTQPSQATPENGLKPAPTNNRNPASGASDQRIAGAWQPSTPEASREVVLALDSNGAAIRLAPGTAMGVGQRIVIPPAFRPEMQLDPGFLWTAAGPSDLLWMGQSVGNRPVVALQQARAIVRLDPLRPDSLTREIELRWGFGNIGVVSLLDPDSVFALELRHFLPPGKSNPAEQLRTSVLTVTSLQGRIQWTTVSLPTTQTTPGLESPILEAGQSLGVVQDAPMQSYILAQAPTWFRESADRPIDRQAASELLRLLPESGPVDLKLTELLKSRRLETASLAARTLAMLDDFSWISGAEGLLNQEKARSHWTAIIDSIRARIAIDPQRCDLLQSSLQQQDDLRGSLLYQLFIGPDESQLAAGQADALVQLLESQYMDERALAAYQLKLITGKDLGYQADRPSKPSLAEWKKLFRSGQIQYGPRLPVPLPEAIP